MGALRCGLHCSSEQATCCPVDRFLSGYQEEEASSAAFLFTVVLKANLLYCDEIVDKHVWNCWQVKVL